MKQGMIQDTRVFKTCLMDRYGSQVTDIVYLPIKNINRYIVSERRSKNIKINSKNCHAWAKKRHAKQSRQAGKYIIKAQLQEQELNLKIEEKEYLEQEMYLDNLELEHYFDTIDRTHCGYFDNDNHWSDDEYGSHQDDDNNNQPLNKDYATP